MRTVSDLLHALFCKRASAYLAYSEPASESFLGQHLDAGDGDTLNVEGVGLDIQVKAAAGLYPVLMITWRFVFDQDVAWEQVHEIFQAQGKGECVFDYRCAFVNLSTQLDLAKKLVETIGFRACGQDPRPPLKRIYACREGERLVHVYFGADPLPDKRTKG
jgi:hypothetical protein